jgi:hypothetical protein
LLVVVTLTFLGLGRRVGEASYAGRPARDWFRDSLGMSDESFFASKVPTAFSQMEGMAVPLLVQELRARPSRLRTIFESTLRRVHLDGFILAHAPGAEVQAARRRRQAMILLWHVAGEQRRRADLGEPLKGPSVTNAIPALRELLQGPQGSELNLAAATAGYLGPLAAPLVDLLAARVAEGDDPEFLVQALGAIGPAASNTIPALARLARNPNYAGDVQTALGLIRSGAAATRPRTNDIEIGTNPPTYVR